LTAKAPGVSPLRRVLIAVPSYTGKITAQTEYTLALFKLEADAFGWGFDILPWGGDSLIAHARNAIVGKFMLSDATDLICLDADVGTVPGAFTRLMTHRVNFVAGLYRAKSEPENYMVRLLSSDVRGDPRTDLLEVESVPFGLVRLTRACIEDMIREYADESFVSHMDNLKCWNLFNTEVRDGQFWGEDYYFCRKWRAIGGRVWVDWEIPTTHTAHDGKVYRGHFGNWVRSKQ
jgi:hypothetical protein